MQHMKGLVSVSIAVPQTISVWSGLAFEVFQVFMCATKHPDGKRELEVRVRDGDVLVEHTLNSFLSPRTILVAP